MHLCYVNAKKSWDYLLVQQNLTQWGQEAFESYEDQRAMTLSIRRLYHCLNLHHHPSREGGHPAAR